MPTEFFYEENGKRRIAICTNLSLQREITHGRFGAAPIRS